MYGNAEPEQIIYRTKVNEFIMYTYIHCNKCKKKSVCASGFSTEFPV